MSGFKSPMSTAWALVILCSGIVLVGCSSNPVSTGGQTQGEALTELQASAITTSELSVHSILVLRTLDLVETWEERPDEVLGILQAVEQNIIAPWKMELTKAEVAYERADEARDPRAAQALFMEAVITAGLALRDVASIGSLFDPRQRLMAEIYNRGLARFLKIGQELDGHPKNWTELRLPSRTIPVDIVKQSASTLDPGYYDKLIPSEEIKQTGIENEYRRFGIGATMVGVRNNIRDGKRLEANRPAIISDPVTVLLRLGNNDRMQLVFHDPRDTKTIGTQGGQSVSLAANFTAPLAHLVSISDLYIELNQSLFNPQSFASRSGLYLDDEYDPDKIPVVLVHGLWSSPLTWLWLVNEINGDEDLKDRFQVWYYAYPTGFPLVYNIANFHGELDRVRKELDPQGDDAAMQDMVFIGHSMGGLLSKSLVKDTQTNLWDQRFTRPYESVQANAEDKELLRRCFFYEPRPYVNRVIFMAVPHRGSSLADGIVGAIGSALISTPPDMEARFAKFLADNPGIARQAEGLDDEGVMNSIDNLSADSPLLAELDRLPFRSGLPFHCIMGDEDGAGIEGGSDGVVPYSSSYLEGAVSEIVVESDHGVTDDPSAMAEVRRILRIHLGANR